MMFSCFEGELSYTVHWHVTSFYLFSPTVYLVVFRNTSSFGEKIMSLGKKTMQPKLPLLMLFSIFCIILLQPSSKRPDPCICPIWKFLKVKVAQSCLSLCYPMDCSLPGSSVHGIFQARILEWVAISLSRGSSRSRDRTLVSCIGVSFFTSWATRES